MPLKPQLLPGFPAFTLLHLGGRRAIAGKVHRPGEGPVDSADPDPDPHPQLALLFYILTFVGAVFNGLTLLILGELGRLWGAVWGGGSLGFGGRQDSRWNS